MNRIGVHVNVNSHVNVNVNTKTPFTVNSHTLAVWPCQGSGAVVAFVCGRAIYRTNLFAS